MGLKEDLPARVHSLLESGILAEYATISSAGVPIDTPTYYFPSEGLASLDIGTGLAYPAKAERARKNPKVGMLIEGLPEEPVISVAGMAAVRDADLQANADRYMAETNYDLPDDVPWPQERKAVWYWTRVLVQVAPARILWWDSWAEMEGPPHRWESPGGASYPESDPAPPGRPSPAPGWPQPSLEEALAQGIESGRPAHLTLIDDDGYPLPIRARKIHRTETGYSLEMPKWLPWSHGGRATLSFEGVFIFVGDAALAGSQVRFDAQRVLPILPMIVDTASLWDPTPAMYETLMGRLQHETQRRGVSIPTIPSKRPAPTEGARRRIARRNILAPSIG